MKVAPSRRRRTLIRFRCSLSARHTSSTRNQYGVAELVRAEAVLREAGGHPLEYRIIGEGAQKLEVAFARLVHAGQDRIHDAQPGFAARCARAQRLLRRTRRRRRPLRTRARELRSSRSQRCARPLTWPSLWLPRSSREYDRARRREAVGRASDLRWRRFRQQNARASSGVTWVYDRVCFVDLAGVCSAGV